MDAPKSKKPRKSRYRSLVNRKNSLIDVAAEFNEEVKCIAYLEAMRWPEGVRCLRCNANRISRFVAKGRERFNRKGEVVRSPDRHLYQCLTCKHQFAVTTGTIFHDTHLPLHKWFQAVALMCDAKKGGSAMQLQRSLRIGSYRTAWYLNHRIRKAMEETPSGPLKGIVEADETYIGGKYNIGGSSRVIRLQSGGTLTLSASLNYLSLSPSDRKFFGDLIDRLDEYEKGANQE